MLLLLTPGLQVEDKREPVETGAVQRHEPAHPDQSFWREGESCPCPRGPRTTQPSALATSHHVIPNMTPLTCEYQKWEKLVEADVYDQKKLDAFVGGNSRL